MYLLDTNVVSESRKAASGKADANVVRWFASVDAPAMYISVITLLELELGVLRVERRDQAQALLLQRWLRSQVLPEFRDRTLAIDTDIALRCAGLHVPDFRPERDALIAATALVHRMTLVTRNVEDFRNCGVNVVNPWLPSGIATH